MAELLLQERLQPSLLDRLTDDDPTVTQESRHKRVMAISTLREVMLRDLGWLLNATSTNRLVTEKEFPIASHSVINYGKPDLTGAHIRHEDLDRIEAGVRKAILDFEPRILANTLKVRVVLGEQSEGSNRLRFEIEGSLWCQPMPLQLFLKTAVDLDTGDVQIASLSF